MSKKTKRTLLTVMAMVLVCVISVMGTIAYLTATTSAVTNTFAAATLVDDDSADFQLKEHKAEPNTADPGQFTLGTEEVNGNTYTGVVPNTEIPKDPFIRVTNLNVKAYLFVEAVDNLPNTMTATVDTGSGKWVETNLTGSHEGKIYYWSSVLNAQDAAQTFPILSGNKVTVASDYVSTTAEQKIEFYAYLAQAQGFDSATAAWNGTFAS